MGRSLIALAAICLAALAVAGGAGADPVSGPPAVVFSANCTGLGDVMLANAGPAHTEALQVVGTSTLVLVPFNGAPGILRRALAAGTICTFAEAPPGFPTTMPVLIING